MTVTGKLTAEELAEAIRMVMFRRARFVFYIWAFAVIVGILTAGLAMAVNPQELLGRLGLMLIVLALFPFLVVGLTWSVAGFSARRQLASSVDLAGQMRLVFGDEQVEMRTPASNSSSSWAAFHKVREANSSFVLFRSNLAFNLVPKRWFSGPGEIDRFRELLRAKLGKKAELKA